MNSSSESILSVVVAGVARSDTLLVVAVVVAGPWKLRDSEVAAVDSDSRRLRDSFARRESVEDWPVASEALVAALGISGSDIAASAAFRFLVEGGVVEAVSLWRATVYELTQLGGNVARGGISSRVFPVQVQGIQRKRF